jgi:acetylornithine deacetylase/succinyl-diaminopimelate desuccinylase-like protein
MLRSTMSVVFPAVLIAAMGAQDVSPARQRGPAEYEALAREIFRELIEINTTQSGSTTRAAEAMAARLKAAGFSQNDVRILGPLPDKGNLVARLRGRNGGQRPIILLAHLDVVEALPKDWTVDPFRFLERDGWFYGRGTTDDKGEAAAWTATLIRFKREGYVPNRDLILMLTADEEGGPNNGVDWLLKNHRPLIDAAFALNEGGGGIVRKGRRLALTVQASEKVYQSFEMLVTNSGGHSSLPRSDNAIHQLATGLTRLAAYAFPVKLNEVTRAFFERTAASESPDVAAAMHAVLRQPTDPAAIRVLSRLPEYNARLRTTCVATMLDGGHAENALPQRARAVVNCRILPGEPPAEVLATLRRVVADAGVVVTPLGEAQPSPPSPLAPEVLRPIEETTADMWPDVPVIPTMSTGATDGVFLRRAGIAVYGVSGMFEDVEDIRAHGRDERVRQAWFFEGLEFGYRLVKRLTGG